MNDGVEREKKKKSQGMKGRTQMEKDEREKNEECWNFKGISRGMIAKKEGKKNRNKRKNEKGTSDERKGKMEEES